MLRRVSGLITVAMIAGSVVFAGAAFAADINRHTIKFASTGAKGAPIVLGMEKFAEILSQKSGGQITVKSFPNGTLGGDVQTISALPQGFAGKPWAADLRITPDGGLIFASERTSSTLQGFRVDPESGRLTPCGSTGTETQPRGIAVDPAGRFLVASGEVSHGITAYAIDTARGTLTPTAHRDVGRIPNWVEIVGLAP